LNSRKVFPFSHSNFNLLFVFLPNFISSGEGSSIDELGFPYKVSGVAIKEWESST
jgi:hypothetical protein